MANYPDYPFYGLTTAQVSNISRAGEQESTTARPFSSPNYVFVPVKQIAMKEGRFDHIRGFFEK